VPVVDGEADGLEGELAGVRAGEERGADVVPGGAPNAVVGHCAARGRREEHAAAGGRVEDEEAGEDALGEVDGRFEEKEALVGVVELEVGGVRGEVEGEARDGGVEGVEVSNTAS
jgi:hypothetical protein